MQPNLTMLPLPQKELLQELSDTPATFTLYGGTALALYLGHRVSVDFDFFSSEEFDPDKLYKTVSYLKSSKILQREAHTLTCLVDRQGPIQVSFFGGLSLESVLKPTVIDGPGVKIASLVDLAGMKAAVIQKRAASRDYIDMDALITQTEIDLTTALASGCIIYGNQFNPYISLKALTYFEEGDLNTLPQAIKSRLVHAVETLTLEKIPTRIAELQKERQEEHDRNSPNTSP